MGVKASLMHLIVQGLKIEQRISNKPPQSKSNYLRNISTGTMVEGL